VQHQCGRVGRFRADQGGDLLVGGDQRVGLHCGVAAANNEEGRAGRLGLERVAGAAQGGHDIVGGHGTQRPDRPVPGTGAHPGDVIAQGERPRQAVGADRPVAGQDGRRLAGRRVVAKQADVQVFHQIAGGGRPGRERQRIGQRNPGRRAGDRPGDDAQCRAILCPDGGGQEQPGQHGEGDQGGGGQADQSGDSGHQSGILGARRIQARGAGLC